MMFLFLFLIFVGTAVALWFQGLWNTAVTLINLVMAMLIATNLFEPISTLLESFDASFTYLYDFIVLWVLFAFVFGILRLITDLLSSKAVKFSLPVEMAGRTILAIWCGWLMVCFVAFSLQMAPLNSETPMGAWQGPFDKTFLLFAPDRQWLGFMQSRSRGALSRGNYSGDVHPNDADLDVETFDPHGKFPVEYHRRRVNYANTEMMRVAE